MDAEGWERDLGRVGWEPVGKVRRGDFGSIVWSCGDM